MDKSPVLILGYNRPDKTRKLLKALENSKPPFIFYSVDGPKEGASCLDIGRIAEVQRAINLINWPTKIEYKFNKYNEGIRFGIPNAVNWAIEKFGRVIVLEDDAIPGADFYPKLNYALSKFEHEKSIAQISGYNAVPNQYLTDHTKGFRLSKYPSSYAWATWDRTWKLYSDDISDIKNILKASTNNLVDYLTWKSHYRLVRRELVSTWAYRWMASIWRNNLFSISPNANLIEYIGQADGTHTRRKRRWKEQKSADIDFYDFEAFPILDKLADDWTSKKIYKCSPLGSIDLMLSNMVLEVLKNKTRS